MSIYRPAECTRPGCGHIVDSHHEGTYACLVRGCDCPRARKPGQPVTVPPPAPTKRSVDADDEPPPSTDPLPAFWPWP